jgi:hypothetical protein
MTGCNWIPSLTQLQLDQVALQIDKVSSQLVQPRMRILQEQNITAHEQLFQDAIRRQVRLQEYGSWYPDEATFQPAVAGRPATAGSAQGPKARGTGASSSAASTPRSSIQAHQRLYSYHRKREVRACGAAVLAFMTWPQGTWLGVRKMGFLRRWSCALLCASLIRPTVSNQEGPYDG